MTNSLQHCKLIILNNDYYKILYNIEIRAWLCNACIIVTNLVMYLYFDDYSG